MILALVWTLPVQKLFLITGLSWGHQHTLSLKDGLSLIPETTLATLLTIGLRKRRGPRSWRFSLDLMTMILVFASWVVVASWVAAGAPLSYQFLQRLVWEPAILHTVLASSTVLSQVLSAIGVLLLVWMGMFVISRWMQPAPLKLIHGRGITAHILLGAGLLYSLPSPSESSSAMQLALVTPFAAGRTALPLNMAALDPRTIAELTPLRHAAPLASAERRKNVAVIVLESIRFQSGSSFDRGFTQALHLDRVYAHHPRSVKTLESLLFGIYPSVPQVTAAWSIDQYAVSLMSPLPRVLQRQGYVTTYHAAMDPVYDNYKGTLQASGFTHIETVVGRSPLVWGRSDAATLFSRLAETLEQGAREGKPQFVMAWTAECHMPYDYVGKKEETKSAKEQYDACQEAVAREVDHLIQRLKQSGRLDDTLVVVLGDHGEIFPEEKSGESGHGYHVYEQSLRIPVLLFLPHYTGPQHDHRLFQPVDIPSTILATLNLPIPESWRGRNILDKEEPGRAFIVFLGMLSDGPLGLLDKTGMKYVRHSQHSPLVSYDLNLDPEERSGQPVDGPTAARIEHQIQTYLALATHGWESRRYKSILSSHALAGSTIANWTKGLCINIIPDEKQGTALIEPLSTPECKNNTDPAERCVLTAFPISTLEAGGFLEVQFQIADGENLQGSHPQAFMKTSSMETPIAVDILPTPGAWQTVSFTLPKADADPISGQQRTDTMIAIAPVNLPVRFTVRSIRIAPLTANLWDRLHAWWSRTLSG